jgi:hypothetical protein
MIAASTLVVAVLASYAGIGLLSLNASSSFSALTQLPGVNAVVTGIGWEKPDLHKFVKLGGNASTAAGSVFGDLSTIAFETVGSSGGDKQVSISNTSSAPLSLRVRAYGAEGVDASFAGGGQTATVKPGKAATINVHSSPTYAGPFAATLQISADGLQSISVPITGDQAPYAPGAVTATPAAGGAVDLSWGPSLSVSGVSGYLVQRSSDGGASWQQVASVPANTTSAVDQTPSDAAYTYQVIAVAVGGAKSSPGPVGGATSDSTGPDAPASVAVGPQFINLKNVQTVPVTVSLPGTTSSSDSVTVTLSDGTHTATQTVPAGSSPITVHVNAQALTDSPNDATPTISVSATATDSLGNPSKQVTGDPVVKDTLAPGAPTLGDLAEITQANQDAYPVTFETTAPTSSADTFTATAQAADGTGQSFTSPAVPVGASSATLPSIQGIDDGQVTITGQITDPAGNPSAAVSATVSKDTVGYPAPTDFGVAAGPDNPAGVVTPQSAHAVMITATFAQAPGVDDTIAVFANHHQVATVSGDGQTTTFSFGPFDFSDLAGGTYKLGMMQTDGVGNQTWTQTTFAVDTGVQGPDSVGVPAGPNNPAGYVNAATQTAATIVATFAAPTDPADQIALSVDGLNLGTQAGGSDTLSWTGDLSSLPDGTLQILGTITDPNGVQTTFSGSLIKDTTPPPAPAVAGVAGPPANVITPHNASCVNVAVAFNQAPDPSDTVTATLSDGQTSVQGSGQAGDGQVTIGCIDAGSLASGTISVTVTVTDVAGNSVTFTGTPAVKVDCQQSSQN